MVKLSASRISTALKCSFQYYFKYVVKTPDASNTGAKKGTVTHQILECLLRENRKPIVEIIIKNNDPFCIPSIKRMAEIWARKLEIFEKDEMAQISKFILTALKIDFYHDGCKSLEAEYEFNIGGENWQAGGFIDKTAIYEDRVKIVDYKTSKSKFKDEELSFNLQNFFYTYAAQQRFPDIPIDFEFQFLKFDNDYPAISAPSISKEEMAGFLQWCSHISDYLDNFNLQKAHSNPAKSNYNNSWLCGKAKFPGEKKKDGLPYFYCQQKFPYIYFSLEENGKIIASERDRTILESIAKEGQEIKTKKHNGCPVWKHLWETKN